MRKTLLAALLVALLPFVPGALSGQDAPPATGGEQAARQARSPEERVDRMLQRMTESLNLSEEQREKIRPILLDQAQQLRALREDKSLSPEDRRAKARALRRDTRLKVDQILTPEQKAKRREHWQNRRGRRGGPPEQAPPQQ